MKLVYFSCDDRYEAEKLAGLMSVQKDGGTYVESIAAIFGNEMVIKLKDKSSHAVVMKDNENLARLERLLHLVVDGKAKVLSSDFEGSVAKINVDGRDDDLVLLLP
jgi:hypothetical protein